MREILIYLALKYNGNFFKIYEAIQREEIVPIEELKEVVRKIETQEIKAITIVDDEYPEAFKRCEYSPIVLFYEGNINLLNKEMAIITGEADESNKLEIEKCIKSLLDRNITFISGLQEKLDFYVASNLLSKNKNIVLVSPNGVKKPLFKFNLNENQVNENIQRLKDAFNNKR